MNCTAVRERLMDVLYGEEHDSRKCFEFFAHIEECPSCKAEYLELVETRSRLAEWVVADPPGRLTSDFPAAQAAPPAVRMFRRRGWLWLQRAAAAVLMIIGAASLMDRAGVRLLGKPVEVSQQQMQDMVNDMLEAKLSAERDRMNRQFQQAYEWLVTDHRSRMSAEVDDLKAVVFRMQESLLERGEQAHAEPHRVRGK